MTAAPSGTRPEHVAATERLRLHRMATGLSTECCDPVSADAGRRANDLGRAQ